MGGWRCTYRNCTVKGDGVTHMFHYPVFDKVRCHQWLVNARRLDFLNLTVSQLRNRCVCQHHFKDDDFMNYKKEKIKCKAVPTEDGPFCDVTKTTFNMKTDVLDYSIFEDEIVNETLRLEEKRAHYPKKYSEFLGSDLTEMYQTSFDYVNMLKSEKSGFSELTDANKIINYPLLTKNNSTSNTAKVQKVPTTSNALYHKLSPTVSKHSLPNVPDSEKFSPDLVELQGKPEISELQHNTKENIEIFNDQAKPQPEIQNVKKPKVLIVSEKTIFKPFKLTGKLEPISSCVLLTPRYLRNKKNQERKGDTSMVKSSESNIPLESIETKISSTTCDELIEKNKMSIKTEEESIKTSEKATEVKLKDDANKIMVPKILQIRNNLRFEDSPPVHPRSPVKPKIAPERLAAIEEKRKFNMQLRNIMETHLSDSKHVADRNVGEYEDIKINSNLKRKSANPQALSFETNDISYLEARMKKFEEVLLSKINQNTQSIVDLKNLIIKSQTPTRNASKSSQTHCISSYKNYLYQELSEYLSPSTQIIVHDELFTKKSVNEIPNKRRKTSKRKVRS